MHTVKEGREKVSSSDAAEGQEVVEHPQVQWDGDGIELSDSDLKEIDALVASSASASAAPGSSELFQAYLQQC